MHSTCLYNPILIRVNQIKIWNTRTLYLFSRQSSQLHLHNINIVYYLYNGRESYVPSCHDNTRSHALLSVMLCDTVLYFGHETAVTLHKTK
jgi:hypothetical protein